MAGLPSINVAFSKLGSTYVDRSSKGTVALILKEGAGTEPIKYVFGDISNVNSTDWTAKNYLAMKLAFLGKPLKIIVIKIATTEKIYTAALQMLSTLRWNYLAVPEIAENETAVISAWIKEQRDVSKKLYKAVLPKTAADHEGVINFSTDNIKTTLSSTSISCGEYCTRIAGLLAGLAATKSCTYYQLSEIVSCDGDINPS
ncbi:MAG: phage tail sheath protein, partial [Oscillospiraceae bacterium]